MFSQFDLQQFIGAFVVLFAVIDVIGVVPIIINLKKHGKKINAEKVSIYSLIMFIGFFYIGEVFLQLFNLNLSSFAVAGSLIIFMMALEMILDIEIFREGPETPHVNLLRESPSASPYRHRFANNGPQTSPWF